MCSGRYTKVTDPIGIGRLCTKTDSAGKAAVEVMNSNGGKVDVIAHFVDEQLLRHIFVDFGTAPAPSEPSTSVPTQQQVAATVGRQRRRGHRPGSPRRQDGGEGEEGDREGRLRSPDEREARPLRRGQGQRDGQRANLKIKLVDAKGKVLLTATRTVKTNKLVPIKNLKIAKTVTGVRAALA